MTWLVLALLGAVMQAGQFAVVTRVPVLAATMSYLLVRATAGGDISIVGPVLATSPVFAIVPDYLMSGSLPRGFGWLGIALSIAGRSRGRGPAGRPRHRRGVLSSTSRPSAIGSAARVMASAGAVLFLLG